jgi:hypothetical protein
MKISWVGGMINEGINRNQNAQQKNEKYSVLNTSSSTVTTTTHANRITDDDYNIDTRKKKLSCTKVKQTHTHRMMKR